MIPGLFLSSVLHDVNIFVEERLRDLKSAHIVQSTEQLVLFFIQPQCALQVETNVFLKATIISCAFLTFFCVGRLQKYRTIHNI